MSSRSAVRAVMAAAGLAAVALECATLVAAPTFRPAKYRDGALPPLPALTVVGGGEVMLELDVTRTGEVRGAKALRSTPAYTELLLTATKTWRFAPAELEIDPPPAEGQPRFRSVDSTVLVAAVFRAPTLNTPTLGDVPRDVGTESDSTPFPFSTVEPIFPPLARDAGVVMIETTIDAAGQVIEPRVLRTSPPFDEAAVAALRQWRFRPARIQGASAATTAYVIMGFRQPVLGAR